MRLRVVPGKAVRRAIPQALATDLDLPSAEVLAAAEHRTIVLVERKMQGQPSMLTMGEFADARAVRWARAMQ